MKRFIYILICLIMALSLAVPSASFADTDELEAITTPHIILYEANTGTVLFNRAEHEKAYPASTTKIMTCIVALEYFEDINRTYTCGYEATNGFGPQSSVLGLQYGYKVTIKDLLYGLMLVSGNDCGACLAVAAAGSTGAFVEMMNAKAQEIGMNDTHYMNAHGLQNDEHYTTAYDMALLMSYALRNDDFRAILSAKEYTVNEVNGKFSKTVYTSNKLLYTKNTDTENNEYRYAIGGKTGETNTAGYTLVEAAEKDGVCLVAVLMGDNNQGGTSMYYRFRNAVKLFNWGFENFLCYDRDDFNTTGSPIASQISLNTLFNVQTIGYEESDASRGLITAEADISDIMIAGTKEELGSIDDSSFVWAEPVLDEQGITAPVEVGDKLGTVDLYLNGKVVFTSDLLAKSAVRAGQNSGKSGEYPGSSPFVTVTTGPSKQKICNLTISKNGGEDKYTTWIYYDGTLCSMADANNFYYLFYDGEVFRTSTDPASKRVTLYQIVEDDNGAAYYVPDAEAVNGGNYLVVCSGKALRASKSGRSLAASALEFDENGYLTSAITADMIWTFTQKGTGNGYQLTNNGRYLHRSPGDGLLFWIIIGVLVIAIAVIARLLIVRRGRGRRRSFKRRNIYRIYRT